MSPHSQSQLHIYQVNLGWIVIKQRPCQVITEMALGRYRLGKPHWLMRIDVVVLGGCCLGSPHSLSRIIIKQLPAEGFTENSIRAASPELIALALGSSFQRISACDLL